MKVADSPPQIFQSLKLNSSATVAFTTHVRVHNAVVGFPSEILEVLPAGIRRKASNVHPESSTSRARRKAAWSLCWKFSRIVMTIATSKLNNQILTFEFSTMKVWDNILRVIWAFILNKAEPIHELNLGNSAVAILIEKILNFLLASFFWQVAEIQARA